MNCINIIDQINCNIVENTAEYLIVNNTAGNMFSLTLNPDTGCSNDYAGIVIMNENLTDPVIVTAILENGMVIDVLATKPFSDTVEFYKQSYVYPLGKEVQSGPSSFSKVVSQKIYFATDNPIPAGYIKFVFTTKYFAATQFAAWIFFANKMYVTDISPQWTKISNFLNGKASISYVGSQGQFQSVGLFPQPLISADVTNNFSPCAADNSVIAQGLFQTSIPADNWTDIIGSSQTKIVTGIMNFGMNLYYNNPCGGYPFNQGQVNATFWSVGQLEPYEDEFIYTDVNKFAYQYINRYTYAFNFNSIGNQFPLTFNKYGYMKFQNALRDYTFKMVNTFVSPYSLCRDATCVTHYSVCRWTLLTANGKIVKSQGYTTDPTTTTTNPPPTSTFEINVSKGESLIIGPYRPSINVGSGFYFFGTITITQNSLMNVTPLPTGSPAPTQPTPTPTPSPSASPGPTPSPSGTAPTSTPFPTVTPLPTVLPGRMWFAGDNTNGQLGTNNDISYSSPVQSIVGGLWKSVEAGSQGFYNTIGAIKDDNTLWIWGQFTYSGVNLSSPIQVVGGGSWLQISQNYALKADGTIWGWNLNQSGQPFGWASSPIQVSNWGGNWIYFNMPSLGVNNFVGIKNDRTLWCAGQNDYGQFGTNSISSPGALISSPVQTVFRTNDWIKIVNDSFYAVALKMNGTVWTWGRNNYGQLGINSTVNKSTPVQVGSENNWVDIACNTFSSFGLKNDGSLWCIGSLGTGSSPVQMMTQYNNIWKNIVSLPYQGWNFILLDDQNNAWSWYADNYFGELGNNDTWQIAPPEPLQLFTAGSNTKWMTGTNNNLTRGVYPSNYYSAFTVLIEDVNPTVTPTNSPTPAATDPSPTPTPTIATATPTPSPSATPTSTPTLSPQPTPTPSFSMTPFPTESPTPSPSPTQKPFMIVTNDVLLSYSNSLTSTSQTIVYSNYEYKIVQPILNVSILSNGYLSIQIGGPQAPVVPVKGSLIINPTGNLADSIFIDLDTYNIISWSGQVFENGYINLILDQSPFTILTGTTGGIITFSTSPPSPTSTPLPTLPPLQQVNGNLFIWGNNSYGQLGNENTAPMSSPVQTLTTTSDWNSCDIKFNHVLSVKDNGQLWVWGNNAYGQLGLDNVTSLSSPVQLIGESNWNFVSAGYWFSLAVNNLGEVWSWGRNNYGQLGNVSIQDFSSPILVSTSAFGTCTKISAGYSHAAALLSDGSLYMWGDNSYGACGFSDNLAISMPTQIVAGSLADPDSVWKDVTCGKYFTLAVQKNGKLWAWGLNDNGQYGNDSVVTSSNPVLIESSSSKWNFISAGEKFSVGGVDYPIGTPVPSMSPTPTATPSPT